MIHVLTVLPPPRVLALKRRVISCVPLMPASSSLHHCSQLARSRVQPRPSVHASDTMGHMHSISASSIAAVTCERRRAVIARGEVAARAPMESQIAMSAQLAVCYASHVPEVTTDP